MVITEHDTPFSMAAWPLPQAVGEWPGACTSRQGRSLGASKSVWQTRGRQSWEKVDQGQEGAVLVTVPLPMSIMQIKKGLGIRIFTWM